jgi:uncharacterized membrane protein
MKKYLLLIISVLLLAACSTPKYAYYFDHYDYNSGKKKVGTPETQISQNIMATPDLSPLQLDEESVTASAESRIKKMENAPVMVKEKALLEKKYSSLSRVEKREFRKELKSVVKKVIKAKKAGESVESIEELKAMDRDLKMALIFTIIAVVLGAFYGANSVFGLLSLIALIVAIVFFIQWIARQ